MNCCEGIVGEISANERVGTALRAFAYPTLATIAERQAARAAISVFAALQLRCLLRLTRSGHQTVLSLRPGPFYELGLRLELGHGRFTN
jgi:hypothetical protein